MNMPTSILRSYRLLLVALFTTLGFMVLWLPTSLGVVLATPSSTITVNSPVDVVADDGICTLREAITAANTDMPSGASAGECIAGDGADTIVFSDTNAPFTVTLGITGSRENGNLTGDLDIFSDVTIQGNPNFTTTIDANQLDRVLDVLTGTVKFQNFTITNGVAPDCMEKYPEPPLNPEPGGGIRNQGILETEALIILNNLAGNNAYICSILGDGGGIWNAGEATLRFTSIVGNSAGDMGGNLPPIDVLHGGYGGGIHNSGILTITHGMISDNRAGDSFGAGGDGGRGGGIYNVASLWIAETIIEKNSAGSGGNGPYDIPGQTGRGGSGGGIYSEGIAVLIDSSIASNVAGRGGNGGRHDTIGGRGGNGGGIVIDSGTLTVTNSTFTDNSAGRGGKGADRDKMDSPGPGGGSGQGGGLMIQNGAVVTVTQTLFYGNEAPIGGEGGSCHSHPNCTPGTPGVGGSGGAVSSQRSTLHLSSSTVTGNVAYHTGGAFYVVSDSMGTFISVTHSTIAFNNAILRGGGVENAGTQFITANSIIGENDAPQSPDCFGALHTHGNLLLENRTGCLITETNTIANIYGIPPFLLPLADNGGNTLTHALDVQSPALDAGNCPSNSTDQRGEPRPFDIVELPNTGNGCDIGAFEAQNPQNVPTRTPTPTTTATPQLLKELYLPLLQRQ